MGKNKLNDTPYNHYYPFTRKNILALFTNNNEDVHKHLLITLLKKELNSVIVLMTMIVYELLLIKSFVTLKSYFKICLLNSKTLQDTKQNF